MKINPTIKLDAFETSFKCIDTHTVGEFTRIIFSGFPVPEGDTPIERKNFIANNYDHFRRALMFEPRGHRNMFGAFITTPISEEADYAVFFMDTGEYLNMCGHGTIGSVTAIIEGGLVEAKEPFTEVVLEAPAGIIRTKAEVKDGKVVNVTLKNVPSFLYKKDLTTTIDGQEVKYDISFGGSFFALVDVEQFGWSVDPKSIPKLTDFGMKMIEAVNKEVTMEHPTLDITTVDLAELYCHTATEGCNYRNVVIFGDNMADRSPCGTGTSAKLAALHARGQIAVNEPFVYESFIGSTFKGLILEETTVGEHKAIVPQITGSAYVTAEATYVIDPADPLKYGFMVD